MSVCVCAKCKKPWGASGSPARCPNCGEINFAIAKEGPAKLSAAKKSWQDPEYRAKLSAAAQIDILLSPLHKIASCSILAMLDEGEDILLESLALA